VTNVMTKYTKRRPSRKQKFAKSAPIASRRDPLAVYDGQTLLGTFIDDEKSGVVLAWNVERKLLGRFCDSKAAADAISDAARVAETKKAATAEALERLNRPEPEFATGLPDDLVGGGRRR
jgi:hypothetical protein